MKKECESCKSENHEKCDTRNPKPGKNKCSCDCVGNPYFGIVCLNLGEL